MTPQILLVDDDGEGCLSLARALKAAGLDAAIEAATSSDVALKLCDKKDPSVVVLDLSLDERTGVESGFQLLQNITARHRHSRAIVLTGHGGVEHGVRALKLGAANFLEKPAHIPHLLELIRDGIRQSDLLRTALKQEDEILNESLVGSSEEIAAVRAEIRIAAQTTQPVFICGETGVGKGVCARLIHNASARKNKNFVRYQATFTSADLVSSDLFGHKKGSFTGATEERNGFLAAANGGSLFLDEIDELPAETQVLLLGVLQDRHYRPVGATNEQASDFRLISASNRNVEKALESGKLRRDLYHRIAHTTIKIPALRERAEDIPELAQHILKTFSRREDLNIFSIAEETGEHLKRYQWLGNVRELESVIEGAAWRAQLRSATEIALADLPRLQENTVSRSAAADLETQVETFKLKIIEDALTRNNGNQVKTALELGCDRSTMRRILKRAVQDN